MGIMKISMAVTVSSGGRLLHSGHADWKHIGSIIEEINPTLLVGEKSSKEIPFKNVAVFSRSFDIDLPLFVLGTLSSESDVLVLGGWRMFRAFLPFASEIHLEMLFGVFPVDGPMFYDGSGLPDFEIDDCHRIENGNGFIGLRYVLRRKQ